MKIHGEKIEGPNVEILVIPRANGKDIILRAQAVLDMDKFEKLCPQPSPPLKIMPGGARIPDLNNPDSNYDKLLDKWAEQKTNFMILKSLEATEGLEWETVNINDSKTWPNYKKELSDSGFSEIEIMRIISCVMDANCLNEDKLVEARESFLLEQQAQQEESSSPGDEKKNSQSGVLATG